MHRTWKIACLTLIMPLLDATYAKDQAPSNTSSALHRELMEMVPSVCEELEAWRGLRFKRPVDITFTNAEEGDRAGWYDFELGKLVVTLQHDRPRFSRGVLVHELHHALQDQHVSLLALDRSAKHADQRRAINAMVEGEAMLAVAELMNYDFRTHAQLKDHGPIEFATFEKIFTYGRGMEFVEHLRKQGGWNRVADAYTNLPQSTREIAFPKTYPSASTRPADIPPATNPKHVEPTGLFDLFWFLAEHEETRTRAYVLAGKVVWSERHQPIAHAAGHESTWHLATEDEATAEELDTFIRAHMDRLRVLRVSRKGRIVSMNMALME